MASKRDWNDMSDDSDQEHHHQEEHQEELKDLPQQLPSLNKIVSSPFPQKKAANEQQNLKKLQNCNKEDIWLYIPLYYKQNVQEIDKALRSQDKLKKIDKFSKGWNVLTSKQNAKSLIVEGKKQGKFFIKFYFSNKNQQGEGRISSYKNLDNMGKYNDYDNKKVKYIPKSPNSRGQIRDLKSPDSFRKLQNGDDKDGSMTPKSPTYKNKDWKKYDDKDNRYKGYNSKPSLKRLDSKGSDNLYMDSRDYKKKYASKNSLQDINSRTNDLNEIESPKKKYKAKDEQTKQTQASNQSISIAKVQKVDKIQETQVPNEVEKDIQQVESNTAAADKKPKKKKTKKDQPLKDDNNPFSLLM